MVIFRELKLDSVMFQCKRWESDGKVWEDIDNRWKEWLKPHMDGEGNVEWVENLIQTFCTKVQPG